MWHRHSLSVKLLCAVGVALFVPLLLTIIWTGAELSDTMFALTDELYANAMGHAADNLNTEMDYIRSIADSYAFDTLLQAHLYADYETSQKVGLLLEAHDYIRNKLTAPTLGFNALRRAVLYTDNPSLWISGSYLYSISELDPDMVEKIVGAGSTGRWIDASAPLLSTSSRLTYLLSNSTPTVSYSRLLHPAFSPGRAIINLQLPLSRLTQYLPDLPGVSYLINQDGMTLTTSAGGFAQPIPYPYMKQLHQWGDRLEADERGMLVSALLLKNGWTLVHEMPREQLFINVDKVRRMSLQIALTIGMVACCIVLVLWRTVLHRIKLLLHKIEQFTRGNLSLPNPIAVRRPSRDEMEVLSVRLDQMAGQMQRLMRENLELGLKRKDSELRALQAQINPHFLYNTLSTIKWMTLSHSAQEIQEIADAMARFYRISLSRGRDIISISDEIECTKAYLAIQRFRTSGRIQVHWQVDEAALEYNVPKLILQPIVENALLHAPTDPQPMTIFISVRVDGSILMLSVSDDGRGISPEILRALRDDKSAENPSMGYGLNNVRKRLELYFGEGVLLDIDSEPGYGTTVRLSIPATPPVALAAQ